MNLNKSLKDLSKLKTLCNFLKENIIENLIDSVSKIEKNILRMSGNVQMIENLEEEEMSDNEDSEHEEFRDYVKTLSRNNKSRIVINTNSNRNYNNVSNNVNGSRFNFNNNTNSNQVNNIHSIFSKPSNRNNIQVSQFSSVDNNTNNTNNLNKNNNRVDYTILSARKFEGIYKSPNIKTNKNIVNNNSSQILNSNLRNLSNLKVNANNSITFPTTKKEIINPPSQLRNPVNTTSRKSLINHNLTQSFPIAYQGQDKFWIATQSVNLNYHEEVSLIVPTPPPVLNKSDEKDPMTRLQTFSYLDKDNVEIKLTGFFYDIDQILQNSIKLTQPACFPSLNKFALFLCISDKDQYRNYSCLNKDSLDKLLIDTLIEDKKEFAAYPIIFEMRILQNSRIFKLRAKRIMSTIQMNVISSFNSNNNLNHNFTINNIENSSQSVLPHAVNNNILSNSDIRPHSVNKFSQFDNNNFNNSGNFMNNNHIDNSNNQSNNSFGYGQANNNMNNNFSNFNLNNCDQNPFQPNQNENYNQGHYFVNNNNYNQAYMNNANPQMNTNIHNMFNPGNYFQQ